MKRLAQRQLLDWKASKRRKPLVLRGARQVGKTWLIEQVLSKEFEHFAMIDLEARTDLHRYFENNLEPSEIIKGLEFVTGRIIPGKTLLFFDEIQACPRAIMALRYFYEKIPELHVVAAGSLLEFAFGEISVPVGRLQYLHLHPMTFYEYLLAIGKDIMAEAILSAPETLNELIQQEIHRELKNFFFVGGMPEAVRTWRDENSFIDVFSVHDDIIESYRDDFHKYTPRVAVDCLDAVLVTASKSVGQQLKYTHLDKEHSYHTNRKAFDLLVKAKLLHKIPSCDPSGLPLGASANGKRFKACILDIGLLQRICQIPVDQAYREDDLLAIYRGRLAEQFVAQELIAWHSRELYYWSRSARNSNAEVDYLTIRDGKIFPIEVKSGPAGRLRSLHQILASYPNCPKGLVLYSGPYKELPEQKLVFMPLYLTTILGNRTQLPL